MSQPSNVTIRPGLEGYFAPADTDSPAPGILVLMEAFGLTDHIRRACDHFAAQGINALAPDIYHGKRFGYENLDQAIAAIRGLDDDQVMDELAAALDCLAAHQGVAPLRLGVLGFCMGGRLAFLANCRHAGRLRAAVAFYGGGIAPEGETDRLGRRAAIASAPALQSPTLLIYGAADAAIPAAEHARVALRLTELNKPYSLSVYPGAGHGFCCEDRPGYAPEAAREAYREATDFLRRTLAAG